jgi:hypothetical protein
MARIGFPLAEDHWRVWQPGHEEAPLASGPVITWASRSRPRIASSLLAAWALPPVLRRKPVARIAVHPGDTNVPALLKSISTTLTRMTRSHRPGRYVDLLSSQQTP